MKSKYRLLLFLIFCLAWQVKAETCDTLRNISNLKLLEISWDNDLILQPDQYYTQGGYILFVHTVLKKNPLRFLSLRPVNSLYHYSLSIHQEIYTPKALKDTVKLEWDYPYAGALYLRSTIVSSNQKKSYRLHTEIDLGFTGPYSGGGFIQNFIHKITGSRPPGGWAYQIKTIPIINLVNK